LLNSFRLIHFQLFPDNCECCWNVAVAVVAVAVVVAAAVVVVVVVVVAVDDDDDVLPWRGSFDAHDDAHDGIRLEALDGGGDDVPRDGKIPDYDGLYVDQPWMMPDWE
jgi:hypothetical protein